MGITPPSGGKIGITREKRLLPLLFGEKQLLGVKNA